MTGLCEASPTVRTPIPACDARAREMSPLAQQAAKVQAIGIHDSITPSSISSPLTPALPSEASVGTPQSPTTILNASECGPTCYKLHARILSRDSALTAAISRQPSIDSRA